MGQGIYFFIGHLLAAHASFFSSLHFGFRSVRSSLHYLPRYIPFINQHKPQQRTASVAPFSAFRSCHPFTPFRPVFGDANPQPNLIAKTSGLHFIPSHSLLCVQSLPLPFPSRF